MLEIVKANQMEKMAKQNTSFIIKQLIRERFGNICYLLLEFDLSDRGYKYRIKVVSTKY